VAIEVEFVRERETKNTVRFQEVESADGTPPAVGTIYVQKYAVRQLGNPDRIRVRIEAGR
jgi:hypothetical protein